MNIYFCTFLCMLLKGFSLGRMQECLVILISCFHVLFAISNVKDSRYVNRDST